jgi:hypothetical protein
MMADRILIFAFCAGLAGYAWPAPGEDLSDLMLFALICGVAALILFFLPRRRAPETAIFEGKGTRNWVVVDGSNVLHWRDGIPQIATLIEVLDTLSAQGFAAGVIFDANVGYKISTRYMDDAELAKLLKLPADQVLVVLKGTPADQVIPKSARDLGARIVSNDRYRDWAEAYPEVAEPGFVIRGGFRRGTLWLGSLDSPPQGVSAAAFA